MRDVLLAHRMAWEQYGILHRDISVGNILIHDVDDGTQKSRAIGLLTDWDLAKTKEGILHPMTSEFPRILSQGTGDFMSAAPAEHPQKPQLLSDDLESAMHVLNWLALKHMRTRYTGTGMKLAHHPATIYGSRFFLHKHPSNHPFIDLLNRLSRICAEHYSAQSPEDVIQAANDGDTSRDTQAEQSFVQLPLLNNHMAFISVFEDVLQQKTWPSLEKLPDQTRTQG
ncbi:hypothetical protein GY45DRAFT_1371335 [Cubamyces sp. BRFM 1775]|nr:hypothetical protein GY45DRAFT_1371335 [Cubamyces sp. BRFM 1775]